MATKKITDLVELISAASGDVLPIVDISDDITKKIQVNNLLASKQDTLVSGTNIKTLNSESLLGSGNIEITASPSGVGGAIQFSDGSAFASDAANLFWDDTNNRLGVGTNVPTSALQVASDAKINGLTVGLGSGAITFNTAVGYEAATTNTTGTGITAIGYQALKNSTGGNNTAFGLQASLNNTSGGQNTSVGASALVFTNSGFSNTAVGFESSRNNGTGSSNTSVGTYSLRANTASNNTAIGFEAATTNTSGTGITAI